MPRRLKAPATSFGFGSPRVVQELWEKTRDLYRAGRLPEAERTCRQLLDTAPHHAQGWFHLGLLAYHAGRSEEALNSYEQAIQLQPKLVRAHNSLGNLHARHGGAANDRE